MVRASEMKIRFLHLAVKLTGLRTAEFLSASGFKVMGYLLYLSSKPALSFGLAEQSNLAEKSLTTQTGNRRLSAIGWFNLVTP